MKTSILAAAIVTCALSAPIVTAQEISTPAGPMSQDPQGDPGTTGVPQSDMGMTGGSQRGPGTMGGPQGDPRMMGGYPGDPRMMGGPQGQGGPGSR